MSLNGISNNPYGNVGAPRPDASRIANERAQQQAQLQQQALRANATPAALKPQAPIAGAGAQAANAVPAEAPPGTDPALWSVLTSEERGFFAKTAAMGPLTYGRIKAVTHPAPPVARGVRLDIRA
jgi:hypothetical protein